MDKVEELISLLSEKNCNNCLYSFIFNNDVICIKNSIKNDTLYNAFSQSYMNMEKVEKLFSCDEWIEKSDELKSICDDIQYCYDLTQLNEKISIMKLSVKIYLYNEKKNK